MRRNIKIVLLSCAIAVAIELLFCWIHSYLYLRGVGIVLGFSLSRVVAILVVYWGLKGLNFLQNNQEYEI